MRTTGHLKLLALAVAIWAVFWVGGLPRYYQQYATAWLAVGCVLITPPFAIAGYMGLARARPERRMRLSWWFAFYGTAPFVLLDTLYCGWYLGLGAGYFEAFWYLTLFYFLPWVIFPPTAWWLNRRAGPSS